MNKSLFTMLIMTILLVGLAVADDLKILVEKRINIEDTSKQQFLIDEGFNDMKISELYSCTEKNCRFYLYKPELINKEFTIYIENKTESELQKERDIIIKDFLNQYAEVRKPIIDSTTTKLQDEKLVIE